MANRIGPRLVMLGTRFETRGGVSSVVNVYRVGGLFERWPVTYIATHCDGGAVRKCFIGLKAAVQFLWLLTVGKVAAVHAHVASFSSFWRKSIFLLFAFAARRPVIFHLHGGNFARFHEQSGPLKRSCIRFILRHSAQVIVLSEQWKRLVAHIVPGLPLVTVPNPVSLPALQNVPRRPAELLFLGRMNRDKGIYDLLSVVAALRRTHPGLRLVCAGDGEIDRVKLRAAELGIAEAVHVAGWLRAVDRQHHLSQCTALVLPSYVEGLPMCVLEAMAAGTAVVATPVGGIPLAVAHGAEGLLVAPGDLEALKNALNLLLSRPQLAHEMGVHGRRKIERRFAAEIVIPQIEALYRAVGLAPMGAGAGRSRAIAGAALHFSAAAGQRFFLRRRAR